MAIKVLAMLSFVVGGTVSLAGLQNHREICFYGVPRYVDNNSHRYRIRVIHQKVRVGLPSINVERDEGSGLRIRWAVKVFV